MPNSIADPLVESLDTDADSPLVRIEGERSGAVTIWIDRPQRRNAMDSLTVAALHEAFETLRGAEGVRIVFLRGAGGCFSDGDDREGLRLSLDLSEDDHRQNALAEAAMLKGLSYIPALTVALVEGVADGLGLGLVAACDLAAAVADARFGAGEVRRGLVAASLTPYLIEAIGPRTARALLARGERIDAAEAEKIGLVQHVVTNRARSKPSPPVWPRKPKSTSSKRSPKPRPLFAASPAAPSTTPYWPKPPISKHGRG
jgi:methylglutaconyl-CoA hydratase